MEKKIFIANRGEIARRIIRTVSKMGHKSVLAVSQSDRWTLGAREADELWELGDGSVLDTYLNQEKIIQGLKVTGAWGVHPGYGFLSENPDFARAVEAQGIVFLGPSATHMEAFALKHRARELAQDAGVSLLPGTEPLVEISAVAAAAESIGYPVILKSSSGGGGIGMSILPNSDGLEHAFNSTRELSRRNFGDDRVFVEKYLPKARHVEVQVFGDGDGGVWILGDRDCSLQRRNQKVVEEAPAPDLTQAQRSALHEDAQALAKSVQYRSAGTLEFLFDPQEGRHYFLEMNTRLQVEHTVTEEIFSVDLVEAMIRLGEGENPFPEGLGRPQGVSFQFRLYAEDPGKSYVPTTGILTEMEIPGDRRLDTWVEKGTDVSSLYDPLLGKIVISDTDRESCLEKASKILDQSKVMGIKTNLGLLRALVNWQDFIDLNHHTRSLDKFPIQEREIEILRAGLQTTVQDLPGRLGYWAVGIPPSGPMDSLSFYESNRLLGNPIVAPGLEMTHKGPKILFRSETKIALTGARMQATLNGKPLDFDCVIDVPSQGILELGALEGAGKRSYLAIEGGFDTPQYLGSASTFTLGQFGGHQGRALATGDVISFGGTKWEEKQEWVPPTWESYSPKAWSEKWVIRVSYGPHASPEYFTSEDMVNVFQKPWQVHFNSSRTGVRLIGPSPNWARKDGGEAGLHPSNIHDNAYAFGAIDFTGDMPVLLGPDGPSLGGFVCPGVIISPDLWKLGQLAPGDTVHFQVVNQDSQGNWKPTSWESEDPTLALLPAGKLFPEIQVKRQGDAFLLLEFGEMKLDLGLRFLVQALYNRLSETEIPGVIDLTPGIRSLQIHFHPMLGGHEKVIHWVKEALVSLDELEDIVLPSRIVSLPLSWDDPATKLAIERYVQGVRPNAPWAPSNIEFIRRINGLSDVSQVKEILFSAKYFVMGLGDVYLGAPVATPLDPARRLVSTKYNPARTWTPENAVGIGGAYLCVYGMEGPGGYQFVGRTLQMWNRYHQTDYFSEDKPWLLDFFDQIQFYPVSAQEILEIREAFPVGQYPLKLQKTTLHYKEFLLKQSQMLESAKSFQENRQKAFEAERQDWITKGLDRFEISAHDLDGSQDQDWENTVDSPMGGSVWKILVREGEAISQDQVVVILESMKMEVEITAQQSGQVEKILTSQGQTIQPGQALLALK